MYLCPLIILLTVLKVTPPLHDTSYLVGVLCKSVGVLLAEVHAGGAVARSQAPAEEEAATSPTGADCGHLSDGDPTWLPGHVPGRRQQMTRQTKDIQTKLNKTTHKKYE